MTFKEYWETLTERSSHRTTYQSEWTLTCDIVDCEEHRTVFNKDICTFKNGKLNKTNDYDAIYDFPLDWVFTRADIEVNDCIYLVTTNKTSESRLATWFEIYGRPLLSQYTLSRDYLSKAVNGMCLDYLSLYLEAGRDAYEDFHRGKTYRGLIFASAFTGLQNEMLIDELIAQACEEQEVKWLHAISYIFDDVHTVGRSDFRTACERAMKKYPLMAAYILEMFKDECKEGELAL